MRRKILMGLDPESIVCVNGEWGVLTKHHQSRPGYRVVDFWNGGRQWVHAATVVGVLPNTGKLTRRRRAAA